MKNLLFTMSAVWFAVLMFSCRGPSAGPVSPIIPQPLELSFGQGSFTISARTTVHTNVDDKRSVCGWLAGLPLDTANVTSTPAKGNSLEIILSGEAGKFTSPEAYDMSISQDGIIIEAAGESGLFYGIQNLYQLYTEYGVHFPVMEIRDQPRFAWRGVMLDAVSHYLSPAFIKKQLDMMARYKLNRLQLYLGGEGGWRIPVRGYPGLVENTAWRQEENYRGWQKSGGEFCSGNALAPHGGFYSREDIADIVGYALSRHITVIPMIDLPCSHGNLAKAAGIECSETSEEAFVKRALTDISAMFPSEYIYLGNGQADITRGTQCPSCRKRVDKEHRVYDDEPNGTTLLSAEKHLDNLATHKLLTWEESLRSGVSTNTAIISWYNVQEGLDAAAKGYRVIMSTSDFVSLDYYQNNPTAEPEAMSGFLPLEKIYAFNPLPPDVEQLHASNIMGVQANMWTHFTEDEACVEYMLYPRLLAFAEVGWSVPARKSWFDFRKRTPGALKYIKGEMYNCFDPEREVIIRPASTEPVKNLAKGKKVHYHTLYDDRYQGSGETTLTDGQRGDWWYDSGGWLGFSNRGVNVTIDLEEQTCVRSICASFINDIAANIYLPSHVMISVSDDGENFTILYEKTESVPDDIPGYNIVDFGWEGEVQTRYIRYQAHTDKRPGYWLFTDEIIML